MLWISRTGKRALSTSILLTSRRCSIWSGMRRCWQANCSSWNCRTASTTGPWTFSRIMPTALSTPYKYQQSPSSRLLQHHSRLGDRARLPFVTAADLHPVHRIFKFADYTYPVVTGVNTDMCQEEIDHIQTWAADHNRKLNRNKTKEIVFSSRRKLALRYRRRVRTLSVSLTCES